MFIDEKEYGLLTEERLLPGDVFYHNGMEKVKETITDEHKLVGCYVMRKGYVSKKGLQVGDIVVLKSGGPLMTIERMEGERAICYWFDLNQLHEADFSIQGLVKHTFSQVAMPSTTSYAMNGGR